MKHSLALEKAFKDLRNDPSLPTAEELVMRDDRPTTSSFVEHKESASHALDRDLEWAKVFDVRRRRSLIKSD